MSLRACLFSRKIFDINGQEQGTIRVEFIPRIRREALREKPKLTRSHAELTLNEDLSSDCEVVSDSSTEEF